MSENLTNQSISLALPPPKRSLSEALNLAESKINTQNPFFLATPSSPDIPEVVVESTLLGRGSMNFIFRGFDLADEREVAIRFSKDPNVPQDEAILLATLDHPCLPEIYKYQKLSILYPPNFDKSKVDYEATKFTSATAGEVTVTTMEIISGPSLEDFMFDGDPDEVYAQAPGIVAQLASVVDYLGQNHIFHRDICGNNIILATPYLKLIDFGVSNPTFIRPESSLVGQNSYNPPESRENWDTMGLPAEVFSLANLTYQLLSGGESAFGHDTFTDLNGNETQGGVPYLWKSWGLTNVPYESLQTKEVASSRLSSSQIEELDRVFKKALDIDPQARYQTASEFCQEFLHAFAETSDSKV